MICHCCGSEDLRELFSSYDLMYKNKKSWAIVYECGNCQLLSIKEQENETYAEEKKALYPQETYYSYQQQDRFLGIKTFLYKVFFSKDNRVMRIVFFPLVQINTKNS